MKKIISLILCFALMSAMFVSANAASDFKKAKDYIPGTLESSRIINSAGDNIYKFNISHPSKISIDLSSNAYKMNLKLHDKSGKELWSDKPAQKASSDALMTYKKDLFINPGEYYFSIISAGQEGNFSFTLTQTPTYESFTETQNGSNNSIKNASAVYVGSSYAGFIAMNDDADYYTFTLPSEGQLTLNVTSEAEQLHTKIYDETGRELWSDSPKGATSQGFSVQNNLYLNKGNYFLSVTKAMGEGQYSFGISLAGANESFSEAQSGNNNKTDAACPIVKNQKYIGFFSLNDDMDIYRIPINDPSLSFTVVSDIHQMQLTIYNQNGKELTNHNITAEKYSGKVNFTKDITVPAGACFMAMKRISGYGAFTFSFSDGSYVKEPPVPQPVICVSVGEKGVSFDQPPILDNGRTLVPLRAIFEALGASVQWNGASQTVTSVKGSTEISLQIGSTAMHVNGTVKTLDVPAKIINGRTLVPVRAVSEAFGCKVGWNQSTQTVTID